MIDLCLNDMWCILCLVQWDTVWVTDSKRSRGFLRGGCVCICWLCTSLIVNCLSRSTTTNCSLCLSVSLIPCILLISIFFSFEQWHVFDLYVSFHLLSFIPSLWMAYSGDLSRLLNEQQHREPSSILSEVLQSRFSHDQPYALLDQHRLFVTNPYKKLELLNDASVQAYADHGYKNLTANDASSVEPHVYEFATRLYYIMRRRKEHVGVILRYEMLIVVMTMIFMSLIAAAFPDQANQPHISIC